MESRKMSDSQEKIVEFLINEYKNGNLIFKKSGEGCFGYLNSDYERTVNEYKAVYKKDDKIICTIKTKFHKYSDEYSRISMIIFKDGIEIETGDFEKIYKELDKKNDLIKSEKEDKIYNEKLKMMKGI
jgi:hypothetical protein